MSKFCVSWWRDAYIITRKYGSKSTARFLDHSCAHSRCVEAGGKLKSPSSLMGGGQRLVWLSCILCGHFKGAICWINFCCKTEWRFLPKTSAYVGDESKTRATACWSLGSHDHWDKWSQASGNCICMVSEVNCFLYFDSWNYTAPALESYSTNFDDEYGNTCTKLIRRPEIVDFIYWFLPVIDNHNKVANIYWDWRKNGLQKTAGFACSQPWLDSQ
jgi:hypothetical protein